MSWNPENMSFVLRIRSDIPSLRLFCAFKTQIKSCDTRSLGNWLFDKILMYDIRLNVNEGKSLQLPLRDLKHCRWMWLKQWINSSYHHTSSFFITLWIASFFCIASFLKCYVYICKWGIVLLNMCKFEIIKAQKNYILNLGHVQSWCLGGFFFFFIHMYFYTFFSVKTF